MFSGNVYRHDINQKPSNLVVPIKLLIRVLHVCYSQDHTFDPCVIAAAGHKGGTFTDALMGAECQVFVSLSGLHGHVWLPHQCFMWGLTSWRRLYDVLITCSRLIHFFAWLIKSHNIQLLIGHIVCLAVADLHSADLR